jgi:hypothetical protein
VNEKLLKTEDSIVSELKSSIDIIKMKNVIQFNNEKQPQALNKTESKQVQNNICETKTELNQNISV